MDNKFYELFQDFYAAHTMVTLPRIQSMAMTFTQVEQPGFIRLLTLNGNSVAFLGDEPIDEARFFNKFCRIDRMVIPEFAQMVNTDVLQEILKSTPDGKAIPIDEKGLFLNDYGLRTSIVMDTCGMTYNCTHQNQYLHSCKNRIPLHHTKNKSGGTCPDPHLTSYFDEDGKLRHKLVLFYISNINLKKTDEQHDGGQTWTIFQRIKAFFADPTFKSGDDNPTINMDELEGVFLIPMLLTDQRICYYCLLNVPGKSNRNVPIKDTLSEWLYYVEKYSNHPDEQVIYIEGNDSDFLYIERWSVFLGRDAVLQVAGKDRALKKEILERKLC